MKISICGAGNGGIALFGELSTLGQNVKIYSDPQHSSKLNYILNSGGYFDLYKSSENPLKVKLCHDDSLSSIKEMVEYSDIIYNTTPINAHNKIFTEVWETACRLNNKKIIFINLSGGFAIYAQSLIQENNPIINIGSTEIFPYACRVEGLNCHLYMQKKSIQIGFTQQLKPEELDTIGSMIAEVTLEYNHNLLEVALGSANYIMHPTITLLNINRINNAEAFLFYREGITPAIRNILSQAEQERLTLANMLGYTNFKSTPQRVSNFYGGSFNDYDGLSQTCVAYANIMGPTSTNSRYLWEDIPCGLVALATLGEIHGVDMSTIKTLINLGVVMTGKNYWDSEYNLIKNVPLGNHINNLMPPPLKGS